MKKTFLFSMGILSLLLFAFTHQEKGVKKIGENLYRVSNTAKFSDKDKEDMKNILKKNYPTVADWSKSVNLMPVGSNTAGEYSWVVDKTVDSRYIDTKAICYDKPTAKMVKPQSSVTLENILKKYTK